MTEEKVSLWRAFPRSFWIANTMEIFERMGWYGFYAVSSLYLTGPVSEGALGFSSEDRGVIQGIVTFFLYLLGSLFGALADRYGFKKMFLASFLVISPSYLLLSLPTSFWGFLTVFMFVAIGHGMFKPVVLGTVAKTTTQKTGSMGYGIFYMMVNIGGLLGPIVAGVVRGWSWSYVFYCSSAWIALNFVLCAIFYKEPERDAEAESKRSFKDVMDGMIVVIGNGRFFLLIAGLMLLLVMGSKWIAFKDVAIYSGAWLVLNFIWDGIFKGNKDKDVHWLAKPMQVGETRFLIFLLLMSGFWTSFNQVFITLPEYIRDYGNTSDVIASLSSISSWISNMVHSQGFLKNGQIKPEYIILINSLGIVFFQVFVSYIARNIKPLMTIIIGIGITALSFFTYLMGPTGWIICGAVLVFSFGEMMASPKAKEYVGNIAPPDKVALYMGYFYWCSALGNLFGGLLSGVAYGYFGPKGVNNPNLMWIFFGVLAIITAIGLQIYDKYVKRHPAK